MSGMHTSRSVRFAEALRRRRIPGVVFGDSPSGREALLVGTGLGVHEIVRTYRDVDENWSRLQTAYHWLSEQQLRAALAYAAAYPDDIERLLKLDEAWTPERVRAEYPFTHRCVEVLPRRRPVA